MQVRFLGSPHVLMSLFYAAIFTIHLALVPLRHVPTARNSPRISPLDVEYPFWHSYYGQTTTRVQALRFGSDTIRDSSSHMMFLFL